MLTELAIIEENVRFAKRGRMLEGILAYPTGHARCGVLIAGPHPFLGGDMRNNLVGSLSQALASMGAVTLAFNYGGVGGSEGGPADWPSVMSTFWKEGTFVEEHNWAADTGAAVTALRQWCDAPAVLVGYSFGCWTIVNHLQASQAKAIVLISPNPNKHEFEPLSDHSAPLLLIHSDNDFTCGASEMNAWFTSIREPKTRVLLPAGEHFFRGREEDVTDTVLSFLRHHDIIPAK